MTAVAHYIGPHIRYTAGARLGIPRLDKVLVRVIYALQPCCAQDCSYSLSEGDTHVLEVNVHV